MSDGAVASDEDREARAALARFPGMAGAAFGPLGRGLINRTFLVENEAGRFVLQKVNPIFDPKIHFNIAAVTARLAACGIATPRLVPTTDGAPFVDLGPGGTWRLMTLVEGTTYDVVAGTAQARSAGALVARFHAALDGLDHAFVGMRLGVHDTPKHLRVLREALASHRDHRLFAEARPLGEAILDAAGALPPLPPLPDRTCHGDLKFNNILFAGDAPSSERAHALVDLDTVGPLPLAFELGDAWRSWCNPSGENHAEATFDLEVFAASLDGYLGGLGRALDAAERAALLGGVEWISVELAARFAADALNERYFGWDPSRYPGRGEHNLLRGRSQLSLHRAVLATRPARARLLGA